MSSVATGPSDCLNCGATLGGAYCVACGQKAAEPNPTLREFLHDLSHELLNVDSKIFRTVWSLLARPGSLTREYFAGRRARYIPPIRLYLIFSILYFVLAAYAPLEMSVSVDAKKGRILHTGGLNISGDFLKGRSEAEAARWVRDLQHEWMPRVMFVMVPVFSLLTMAAARKQQHNFPQHLYFAIHVHAAWFGILALAEAIRYARQPIVTQVATVISLVGLLGYTVTAIHRVYGVSRLRALWRSIWILFVYWSLLILVTVVLFLSTYFAELK